MTELRTLRRAKLLVLKTIARASFARALLIRFLPRSRDPKGHPFDKFYNIETSGFVPAHLLSTGYPAKSLSENKVCAYFGCQPNCARRAIEQVSDPESYTFYDFGCGMGRATIIASEFPFKRIVGVEISSDLSEIASRNAEEISRTYPDRTTIDIVNGDAGDFDIAAEHVVLFLYHPFGPEILSKILANLERLVSLEFKVHIIYENPVHHGILDNSDHFVRSFGEQVGCDVDELGYLLDPDESVVIWRSLGTNEPRRDEAFSIVTTIPGLRVEVSSGQSVTPF